MTNETNTNERMTLYLYGRLDGRELDAFEELLFADADLAAELDAHENDLVDRYASGEMSDAESREFKALYLISERRADKVAAARVINSQIARSAETVSPQSDKPSFWQAFAAFFRPKAVAFAGGLAALAILLIGGYLISLLTPDSRLVANGVPEIGSPSPQLTNGAVAATPEIRLPQERPPAATPTPGSNSRRPVNEAEQKKPTVLAFTLLPPIRSSGKPVLEIPAGTGTVRFRLTDVLDPKYTLYRVELRDGSGSDVWHTEVRRVSADSRGLLTVSVPGSRLRSGPYEMAVSGITGDGSIEEINFFGFVVRSGPEQ